MNAGASLTAGAVAGTGGFMLAVAFIRPRPPLATVITRLHRQPIAASGDGGVGEWTLRRVGSDRITAGRVRADLAVLDRPSAVYAATLTYATLTGIFVPLLATALLRVVGVGVGWIMPIWACLAGAATAVGIVVMATRGEADTTRTALRHQLGAYLDVLAMLLAAGEADEQALQVAAAAGDSALFHALTRAFRDAAIAGQPVLTGMATLGGRWALPELIEIANAGSLAASDGAAIRRTLMAKARAMRTTQLAAEETAARLRTNKLGLPQILLAIGFIILVLYPAFAGLLTGLDTPTP